MSYVVQITDNGELAINNGQCQIPKDVIKSAVDEFKVKIGSQNVLGHLCRSGCDEVACAGFSHKVASVFCSGGEGFAVIEPINTPDGHELNRIMNGCDGIVENSAKYGFAVKGYMDQGEFNLTSIDVVKK